MKHTFYDVKTKSKVTVDVVDKVAYQNSRGYRYALEGKTDDGRKLIGFVSKAVWDAADI